MRLPISSRPSPWGSCRPHIFALALLCLSTAYWTAPRAIAQTSAPTTRELSHQSEQWTQIQGHLPDPATATPQILEQQADILRARRFPEDALDYYKFALARGGKVSPLLNKLGLTELEMKNVVLARGYFRRATNLDRKSASAWNNLGAVEYLNRDTEEAIADYKRAIKLDRHMAVFHANLATVCFETKDYKRARHEMAQALDLDPTIFDKDPSSGGVSAHVLTSEDRARFAYEMAKLYAHNGDVEQMLHSLAMASEAGMDVQREMRRDLMLAKYEMDPRVVVLVRNAQQLRTGRASNVNPFSTPENDSAPAASKPQSD